MRFELQRKRTSVAAGILPAVEGGILPPGSVLEFRGTAIPPGRMPGSTAGRMPAATGQSGDNNEHPVRRAAFTLIELILVMAVLTIAASITAPALAHFFRGRTLDSEVRRVLALTREGQSRAVSTGLPVELWFDTPHSSFGLEVELSYESEDPKAVELTMDSDIQLDLSNSSGNTTGTGSTSAAMQMSRHSGLPKIRFLPDGSIAETSPKTLVFTGRDGNSLWLQQSRNGLSYEIRTRPN